jgi:hypothetical protein
MKKAKAKAKTAKTAKAADGGGLHALTRAIEIMTDELVRNTEALDRMTVALAAKASRSPARAAPRPEQTTERNPEPAAAEQ